MLDAQQMCAEVAEHCKVDAGQSLVMSTGVIGHALPMGKISAGIPKAVASLAPTQQAFADASDGILTTDISRKVGSRSFEIQGKQINLCGMAKGAGMIGPNMATMLGCFATDVSLTSEQAQQVLSAATDKSFNCISVEGHTSTNDTVLLLANGHSEVGPLSETELSLFAEHLTDLSIELAKMIPTDGEGASHLIEVRVSGAKNDDEANEIARVVAASNLVKTAVYGNDPNWGRIVSAAGYANAELEMGKLRLALNEIPLF